MKVKFADLFKGHFVSILPSAMLVRGLADLSSQLGEEDLAATQGSGGSRSHRPQQGWQNHPVVMSENT